MTMAKRVMTVKKATRRPARPVPKALRPGKVAAAAAAVVVVVVAMVPVPMGRLAHRVR
jgi:hypothetical protein